MDRERGAEDGCGEEVRWVGVAAGFAEGVAMLKSKLARRYGIGRLLCCTKRRKVRLCLNILKRKQITMRGCCLGTYARDRSLVRCAGPISSPDSSSLPRLQQHRLCN